MSIRLRRIFTVFLLIFTVFSAVFFVLSQKIGGLIVKLSEYDITDAVTLSVNYAVDDVLKAISGSATEIITIEGTVIAEKTNVSYINRFQTALVNKLYQLIPNDSGSVIRFPLGSVLGSGLFSGLLPKIPVRINSVSNIGYELIDSFTSAGVNQTLHRIYIRLSVDLSVLLPCYEGSCNVIHDVLISETVIVGDVPYSIVTDTSGGKNG